MDPVDGWQDNVFEKGGPGSGRRPSGNITDSDNISENGENEFKKGFSSHNLDVHTDRHLKEYPNFTKEKYAARALELIQKATNETILGYKNQYGQIIRYDKTTNDFVKGHPKVGIATMYKPKRGEQYYLEQKESDKK